MPFRLKLIKSPRFLAGIELIAIFSVWSVTVWGAWRLTGASVWTVAGFSVLYGIILGSVLIRRPGWKNSGFRFDNFWPALIRVGIPTVLSLILFVTVGWFSGLQLRPFTAARVIERLFSGVLQEAFFLGYMFYRWNTLIQNPIGAVIANAFTFSLIHLPHLPFVILTALGGLFLGALFLKSRNVFVIGIAHGFFSLIILPMIISGGFIKSAVIGPPELAPLAKKIVQRWRPGNQIGVGPHDVSLRHFGLRFRFRVLKIGNRHNDDRSNREKVQKFLTAEGRVFCAISKSDYYRYVDSDLRKDTVILGKSHVWKRSLTFNKEWLQRLFFGEGDIPVLAAFRVPVLLVSNKPDKN